MEAPIAQLFDEYFPSVYKYVFFRVQNQMDTEDIVADVFEKVLKHYAEFTPQKGATVRSWIFAIVRNTLIDYFRKKRPNGLEHAEHIADDVDRSIYDAADLTIDLKRVFTHIEKLPPRQQEIVLLRYQSDLSNKEIAVLLDVKPKTVSASLAEALKTLRLHMNA